MVKLKILFLLLLFVPIAIFAQQDSVQSGAYEWKLPDKVKQKKINSNVLLQGKVHDFKWLQVSANFLTSTGSIKQIIPDTFEQVMIVKDGWCQIYMNDTSYTLTPGSVVVLVPGQKYSLQTGKKALEFFSMKYCSKKPTDTQRNNRSFVKIWENVSFKPNNKGGGSRDFFEQSTPMQQRFEMHVTTLKEGLKSHEPHTHRAEEIVWMLEGETSMQLGNDIVTTKVGGFYYLGSNVSHAIKNIGTKPATYFAFQFE